MFTLSIAMIRCPYLQAAVGLNVEEIGKPITSIHLHTRLASGKCMMHVFQDISMDGSKNRQLFAS